MEERISRDASFGGKTETNTTSVGEAFNSACYPPWVFITQNVYFEQLLNRVRKKISSVATLQEREGICDWWLVIMPPTSSNIPSFRKLV